MSAREVASDTGLSLPDAGRARNRLGSEPLLWQDSASALAQFTAILKTHGLQLTRGGRYWHVLGGSDKADAMTTLIKMYRTHGYPPFITLALGDSANDASMLNKADIAVAIRRKDGGVLDLPAHDRTLVSNLPGPRGWNAAVQQLLTTLSPAGVFGPTVKENANV
jgi:mannosyl-3-phosphoglycerate phosphatase